MKKYILYILIGCLAHGVVAQRTTRADRYFESGDYLNAIKAYEQELEKSVSKKVIQNLADAYYRTYDFKQAARYLKKFVEGRYPEKDKTFDNHYRFMLYQMLSANGDYEQGVEYLADYKENLATPIAIDPTEVVQEIEEIRLKTPDYKVKKVKFNSDNSDFGAVRKDSLIYFVSNRRPHGILDKEYRWTHAPFLDIYTVKAKTKLLDKNNEPVAFSNTINSKLHEGNFCFSQDGKTIYFSRSNSEKGKKKFDSLRINRIHIYKSTLETDGWSKPEKLAFNSSNFSVEHPSLSADGNTLYFASDMPGGLGGYDIYYVNINADGTYSQPVNMGPVINTENREQFPFISEKGDLFFSSNGHLGMGMMDIFVSENQEGKFTKPVNLGTPVNSRFDDFSLTYHNETDGYFSSNRSKNVDNIYSFKQEGEIFEREYIVQFEVRDEATKEFVTNAEVTLKQRSKAIYSNTLDSIASFSVNISPATYLFRAKAEGYITGESSVRTKEENNNTYILYLAKEQKNEIALETANDSIAPNSAGGALADGVNRDATNGNITSGHTADQERARVTQETPEQVLARLKADTEGPEIYERDGKMFFKVPPIYFNYNKWDIREDSQKVLDDFAQKLDRFPSIYIKITSHTDSRGSDRYNQVLSAKRAESTRNYLALIGYVNARRMKFEGKGESEPLIDCGKKCSEEEHQFNRRSDFEIIKY